MRKLHLTNAASRDATVSCRSLRPPPPPKKGLPGKTVRFRRFLAATDEGSHATLAAALGEDYGQELVSGDPEVDLERIGRTLPRTDTVFLSSTGDVLYAAPQVLEVITDPSGEERERRAPVDVPANVNEESPVRWTGRKMDKAAAVRRFAFRRTLQVNHVDGLTYDYLFGMAKTLADTGELVFIGGGPKGRDPLVFQTNGTPYRGFLEGRVDGERYQLLLHLSNMELKLPEEEEE